MAIWKPDIGDYRVQFVVYGTCAAACAKKAIAEFSKTGDCIKYPLPKDVGLGEAAQYLRDAAAEKPYEMALSAPLPSMQRAREYAELAEKNGATKVRIEAKFTVRESAASEKFFATKNVPEDIRRMATA